MSIIRIAVILLVLSVAVLLPKATFASETTNTETKTNTNIDPIAELFSLKPVLALGKTTDTIKKNNHEIPKKTAQEIEQEKILGKWKEKQADKWAKLPTETFLVNASAYTASADECGNDEGITASGLKVEPKRTIACPPELPFGVKLEIEGQGIFVCEDRGGAIKGNHIDIYMETKGEAFAFGRQNLNAKVIID
ncbi:MAG: 3D domain-containing protein [Candidatus Moraniibacteriota bacterium]